MPSSDFFWDFVITTTINRKLVNDYLSHSETFRGHNNNFPIYREVNDTLTESLCSVYKKIYKDNEESPGIESHCHCCWRFFTEYNLPGNEWEPSGHNVILTMTDGNRRKRDGTKRKRGYTRRKATLNKRSIQWI